MRSHPILEASARAGVRLGLDRVQTFLGVLGEPQLCAPAVHVAGTNGKGSVCAYVTSALVQAGYRVGTTISPHVEEVNERIQLDGHPIDDARLVELLEQVDRARREWVEVAGERVEALTYFELATCAAFLCFAQERVDVMVVEVGLGGRLDATNVVRSVVCAVPSIGLDHTAELGPDLTSVAREKAGIFQKGVPVVAGVLPPEAKTVIELAARRLSAPLWVPPQIRREPHRDGRWTIHTPGGRVGPVRLGMEGVHQGINASVAVGALHQLRSQGFLLPDEAIATGLEKAMVPVRLETLAPGLIADGAHNPDGTRALAAWLTKRERPKSRILLLGMGQDRDPAEVVAPLVEHFDEIVTTRCSHPKARESSDLAHILADLHPMVTDGGTIEEILPEVYAEAEETIVAGSLFLAGAARSLVREGVLAGIEPGKGIEQLDEVGE
ncbi:MAG: bifunctional folylpolyglutamate synthase/dihydrofolate synthase [Myxococcales bacterium]|nr:bifunctional folylpolyglutamate synthase/dihydrofolate synthase [Myxococcales bacterium]